MPLHFFCLARGWGPGWPQPWAKGGQEGSQLAPSVPRLLRMDASSRLGQKVTSRSQQQGLSPPSVSLVDSTQLLHSHSSPHACYCWQNTNSTASATWPTNKSAWGMAENASQAKKKTFQTSKGLALFNDCDWMFLTWGNSREEQDVNGGLCSKLTLSPFCGFYLFYNRSLDPTKNKLARSME